VALLDNGMELEHATVDGLAKVECFFAGHGEENINALTMLLKVFGVKLFHLVGLLRGGQILDLQFFLLACFPFLTHAGIHSILQPALCVGSAQVLP
jgi:hypothetical protein